MKKSGCSSKLAGVGCLIIGFFAFILVLAVMLSGGEESREPVASVTAPQLYASYAKNEISADNDYHDKYLEVLGVVDMVGKNIVGDPYVTLATNDMVGRVQCMIADDDVAKASQVRRGQQITFIGKCNGKELLNVVLYECKIK